MHREHKKTEPELSNGMNLKDKLKVIMRKIGMTTELCSGSDSVVKELVS
jgi:hypothetical protein